MRTALKVSGNGFALWLVVLLLIFMAGCTPQPQLMLMPTPVIYTDSQIDPFKHLKPHYKKTTSEIHYATNRVARYDGDTVEYQNAMDPAIHVGTATVHMGHPGTSWEDLYTASLSSDNREPTPVFLGKIIESATFDQEVSFLNAPLTLKQRVFFDSINAELAKANDKEIMLYVHGTKVDFANSAILTAEIEHFAGRDFVGVAFAWPSHQNIFQYLIKTDVKRALLSSVSLRNIILSLSLYTNAEQINILSYSAGGKVTSKALSELRNLYPDIGATELRDKLRIGSVVFAAVDVEVDIFLERLPSISTLAQQVVITVSDNDNALLAAKLFMGGDLRTGSSEAEFREEVYIFKQHLSNVEIIDVSIGQDLRGFDIVGHHYWYRHPWMSSDIIFLMRTNLPPARRGLSATKNESVWSLSASYPERIRKAVKVELQGQW